MRRADLAHQLDRPHVDAELQRRRRHQRCQLPGAQAALDQLAALAGQRSVMRGHLVVAKTLSELMGDSLGQLSRVDEHQRRPLPGHVCGDPVEDLVKLIAGHRRLELAVGHLQGHVEAATVTGVDDRRERLAERPNQQAGRPLDGFDRRREPDPHGRTVGHRLEPLEREREMRPALIAREGVDLVDYDRRDGREGSP